MMNPRNVVDNILSLPSKITNGGGTNTSVTLMLDSHAYKEKPPKPKKKGEITEHQKSATRLRSGKCTLSLPEFVETVLTGHSFIPAEFQKGRCIRQNWISQQVFALDFDSGWTLEAFWKMSNKYGIQPFLVYPSFSYTPEDERFRAVFVCDQVIYDLRLRDLVQNVFFDMYSAMTASGKLTPDKICRPPSHFFFGTNKPSIHIDLNVRFNPADLADNFLKVRQQEEDKNFSRFRAKFAEENHINLCGRKKLGVFIFYSYLNEDGNEEFQVGSPIIYKRKTKDSSKLVETGSNPDLQTQVKHSGAILQIWWTIDHQTCLHKISPQFHKQKSKNKNKSPNIQSCKDLQSKIPIRISDSKEALSNRCRLLKEFKEGTKHLCHQERLLIGSNLLNTNGGQKFYNECLQSRDDYDYPDEMFEDIKNRDYKPMGCAENCPYDKECNHKKNLLQQVPVRRSEYRHLYYWPDAKPLNATQEEIRNALKEALSAPYPGVTVIKSDTGSGKTEQLKHVNISRACIAFDTHRLKSEAYERIAWEKGRETFLWDIPPRLPAALQAELNRVQRLGITGTMQIYKDALNSEEVKNDIEWRYMIEDYIHNAERVHMEQHMFTTHEKAMHLKKVDTLIFDEDPIGTFIRIVPIEVADIKLIIEAAKQQNTERSRKIAAHLMKVLRSGADVAHDILSSYHPRETLEALIKEMPDTFQSNMGMLFTGNAYVRSITDADNPEKVYVVDRRLPLPDTKIIIMSATADEYVYRRLFGPRLKFIDLSGTKTKGQCIFHPGRGYSKGSINQMGEDAFIKQVAADQAQYGFEAVITHKFIAGKLNEHVPVLGHFGGLAGIDKWGGKSIAVYGTPHPPECVYRLYAHVLKIPNSKDAIKFDWREIIRGEFEFQMQLCSGLPALQDLQLWMIESELAQAVGRARLIHHDTKVHLFSSVPVPGCVLDREVDHIARMN